MFAANAILIPVQLKVTKKKNYLAGMCLVAVAVMFVSFKENTQPDYAIGYNSKLSTFKAAQRRLIGIVSATGVMDSSSKEKIRTAIDDTRAAMKQADFWLRYLEPLAYKSINSPLPVEWETEVFEKFEKPYKRDGAGLTLAYLYLDDEHPEKDTLKRLIATALNATEVYSADSITQTLGTYHHFFLCNRLFLLNLAAIYTTGFECPNTNRIIPELRIMLDAVGGIYESYNSSFPSTPLPAAYMDLYARMKRYVATQPGDYTRFDHYTFIKDYVNPLFIANQQLVLQYNVVSHSLSDYSLNKKATSIFDKGLYLGQNPKGIFLRVNDSAALANIERVGRLLFYDPILSGNNMRSCASCHKPTQYFTDTSVATALRFDRKASLPRNTPSLINAGFNHLLMLDGKHISLQNQGRDVITNPAEMACLEKDAVEKVLSCNGYRHTFKKLLQYTPQEKEVTYEHIVSAMSFYYSKFSKYYSPFDDAVNGKTVLDERSRAGFNLFMSKAQCATCHFVPQFNGVKPPYIGSEFEVLGVPADAAYTRLSTDEGRYTINPAKETRNAFRTGTVRNAAHTMPYMHNGVFGRMGQVIDFYDGGGGSGRGLQVPNQTLSSDSLKLTGSEKANLIAFINSLDEVIIFQAAPDELPQSKIKSLNSRKVGGEY